MNRRVLYSLAVVSVFVLILFSCAELQKQIMLDEEQKMEDRGKLRIV